jgi:hypothetical protein
MGRRIAKESTQLEHEQPEKQQDGNHRNDHDHRQSLSLALRA